MPTIAVYKRIQMSTELPGEKWSTFASVVTFSGSDRSNGLPLGSFNLNNLLWMAI